MTRELNGSAGEVLQKSCDTLKSRAMSAVQADQDGEKAERGGFASELEAAEWGKVGALEPSPYSLGNFHIPRKNKEQKALFQYLPPESREFEDIVRILHTSYLESSSMGAFSYAKPRLVHSELLVKDFCEKRRELKLEGRTDCELQESYCFLLTDTSKLPVICEKGLNVGHSRVSMQGKPDSGVCLSRYSDLLQINPFAVGASGEIIIFKAIKGKVKKVFLKDTKSPLEPTPGFDCHVSKKASAVTSLLSYRAFEITQQYFYEYEFASIRQRPRHVYPYAVMSFLFQGRQVAPPPKPTAPHRAISHSIKASGVRSRYAVWSGQLHSLGQVVSEVSFCSSSRASLPIKLPETLEVGTAVTMEQLKKMIPPALLSLNTYGKISEVMQSGLYCTLFDVESKGRGTLTDLMKTLDSEAMVLVKPLNDGGFLLLLSSAQMVNPEGRCGDWVWQLQALFIFRRSREVMRPSWSSLEERPPGSEVMDGLEPFLPALQYALQKLRVSNPVNMAAGAERQASSYLYRCGRGFLEPHGMREYQQSLDMVERLYAAPRRVLDLGRPLMAYVSRPDTYTLPVSQAQSMVKRLTRPAERPPRRRSPASSVAVAEDPEAGVQEPGAAQDEYNPVLINSLLNIIKMRKEKQEAEPGGGQGVEPIMGQGAGPVTAQEVNFGEEDMELVDEEEEEEEEALASVHGLKRKCEDESTETPSKYLRRDESRTGVRAQGFQSSEDGLPHSPRAQRDLSPAVRFPPGRTWQSPSEGADGIAEAAARVGGASPCDLDSVLDEQLGNFSSEMQELLREEGVRYRSQRGRLGPALQPLAFSDYFSHHASPAFAQHYIRDLWKGMSRLIDCQPAPPSCTARPTKGPVTPPPCEDREAETVCSRVEFLVDQLLTQRTPPAEQTCPVPDSAPCPVPDSAPCPVPDSAPCPVPDSAPCPAPLPGPEDLTSGVLDAARPSQGTDRFYIHPGSQPESQSCCKIKEYLKSLGKEECDPQVFLQQPSSADRLLVVIENQDIATHLHKIPDLVSLKKQGARVSFAGVDGPDDLKDCTYNELLVSGGFLVSDEFLLSPDFITHGSLQTLLTSLEGRSSPENTWCWKIHCKTKKKLKELSRTNSEALLLFDLLCSYQKRRLVEFLPYHECDASDRRAPDLPCLIHLQAQNSQLRHAVFLTERRVEMFPGYLGNGIAIANIDDVTNHFEVLVGPGNKNVEPPVSPPPPPPPREFQAPLPPAGELHSPPPPPPPPPREESRPPLPELEYGSPSPQAQLVPSPRMQAGPDSSDPFQGLEALKFTISQFEASWLASGQQREQELGEAAIFQPYQSFLNPTSLWTPTSDGWGALRLSAASACCSPGIGYGAAPTQLQFGHHGSVSPTCPPAEAPPPACVGPTYPPS